LHEFVERDRLTASTTASRRTGVFVPVDEAIEVALVDEELPHRAAVSRPWARQTDVREVPANHQLSRLSV
jgi:hypothetical protein